MKFKRMSELDLKDKRVFIRSDLNVPQDELGNITDDTRIRASLEAIRFALAAGAAVMVTSHLGRPKEGMLTAADSLQPIAENLAKHLDKPVRLVSNWISGVEVASGEVVLLENCRCNRGEKADDPELAQQMANLCDIYVNDAFGTAHRAEATTHGIARFAKVAAAGPLLAAELDALTKAFLSPKRPLVAIVGGSKVSTKISVLEALAEKVDHLIVGGGIANTFMLANGLSVGKSLVEEAMQDSAHKVIKAITSRGGKVPIPLDVVVAEEFSSEAKAVIKSANQVDANDMILDVGPKTRELFAKLLSNAATIVWNGPIGVFEFPAFAEGTKALANAIASSSAFSLAGGGDTLAAIAQFKVSEQIDYISTGGGAFLEFLEGRTLPAVAALQARADN